MFDTASSPIRTVADIHAVNADAVSSTGYFDPGYLESTGRRIVGSPIPTDDDRGHVIVALPGGSYGVTFYQRTHYLNGHGLHNYAVTSRVFRHVSSARRFARSL